MENLRKIEKKVNDKWVEIPFTELKNGDTFRMFESTGEPVVDPNHGNPRTEFLAIGDLYEYKETGQWMIEVEGEITD
jgi:hypothetical protein